MSSPKDNPSRRLVRRSSRIHGNGVFAAKPIAKNERLIEYQGERLPSHEADARHMRLENESAHTFLFSVNEEITIDATFKGNLAKWINHSCGPNCEAVEEDGRIFIESVKPIAPGEEITYDYRFILEERHTPANKRRFQCICGSKECRGTMLARKR